MRCARLLRPLFSGPLSLFRRLVDEVFTPRGRRRLRRRLLSRLLVLLPVLVWTYWFSTAFWSGEVTRYLRGRVVVEGPRAPVLGLAVVLVPDPLDPDAGYDGYRTVDPIGFSPVLTAEDAAVWLWTDPDGWFDTMHVAPGRRYRIEVRRPGADCPVHVVGHRVFRLLDFFSRRLAIRVPPCPLG